MPTKKTQRDGNRIHDRAKGLRVSVAAERMKGLNQRMDQVEDTVDRTFQWNRELGGRKRVVLSIGRKIDQNAEWHRLERMKEKADPGKNHSQGSHRAGQPCMAESTIANL